MESPLSLHIHSDRLNQYSVVRVVVFQVKALFFSRQQPTSGRMTLSEEEVLSTCWLQFHTYQQLCDSREKILQAELIASLCR